MEILFILFIFFAIITVIGHAIWVALAWFFRQFKAQEEEPRGASYESLNLGREKCPKCGDERYRREEACRVCGWTSVSTAKMELLKDLAATARQMARLHKAGAIDDETFAEMMRVVEAERERLHAPARRPAPAAPPTTPQPVAPPVIRTPTTTPPPTPQPAPPAPIHTPSFMGDNGEQTAGASSRPAHGWAADGRSGERKEPAAARVPVVEPSKPFAEVLAAFMEQSNIRWGEIIGGLLIIGCSTALVISLWNEIARVPVLKFIIFTTVTAALFGVGFYMEHHWKLPTTSRGILTIATLLVPLNFLAIAAVSGGSVPTGGLVVLMSELIAPALFLCLVYFAGRVITPAWPHLLASGVLGSSVGQLLVRHFAGPTSGPFTLLLLGAFPVLCYVVAGGFVLRRGASEEELNEGQANSILVTLGAATFATLLPIGLLLFKTGPATLMHIAPLISLGSVPLLMNGLLLHRRVKDRTLEATHTAGTSIAVIGALVCVLGIVLGWPKPASVASAALICFAVFTTVALLFEVALAHLLAATCFALAFLVASQAVLGHVAWQQTHGSLLGALVTVSSGQLLTPLFVLFVVASEELKRRKQSEASLYYLLVAGLMSALGLALVTFYGFGRAGDPDSITLIYAVYAAGAFWLAWRRPLAALNWAGSFLLLLTLVQGLGAWLGVRFPWQAALLAHASLCALAAIFLQRESDEKRRALTRPLNLTALVGSSLFLLLLLQARRWEPTAMIAARLFWLSGVWLLLLWLNRTRLLLAAFQLALTTAVLLAVKLFLQGFSWYEYRPGAWLHPWSLQVQGSTLVLLSLGWIALRIVMRRYAGAVSESPQDEGWAQAAWRLLNARASFDRLVPIFVLCGFALLAIYGAMPGVKQELAARGTTPYVWNLAGFPHEHVLEAGSWSLLVLLIVNMLANVWERRSARYLLSLTLALACACPLLAGRWEASYATASAWRWLAVLFLILASIPLLLRDRLVGQLRTFGWPEIEPGAFDPSRSVRALLLMLSLTPVVLLTLYPALRAIWYIPPTGPASGLFYLIGDVLSYTIPLALVALVLVGHAWRERLPSYAFVAGLFLNGAVMLALVLTVSRAGGSMNRVVLAQAAQLSAIVSAGYALIWLSWRRRWRERVPEAKAAVAESLLKIQLGICLAINALLIAPPLVKLFVRPTWTGIGTFEAGSTFGWLALVLTGLAVAWFGRAFGKRLQAGHLFAAALAVGALIAFDLSRLDAGQRWLGFHAFLSASTLAAWLMLMARRLPTYIDERVRERLAADWEWDAALFAVLGQALTIMLALRAAASDPERPWWSVGALLAMGLLAAGLNWQTLRRVHLYAAAAMFNVAASICWVILFDEPRSAGVTLAEFLEVNLIALSLPGVVWMLLELRASRIEGERRQIAPPAFHHIAATVALALMAYVVQLDGFEYFSGRTLIVKPALGWLALASVAVLLIACLWDKKATYALAFLYMLGLMAAWMTLNRFELAPRRFAWVGMAVLAAYAVTTSALWKSRGALMKQAGRLGIPERTGGAEAGLAWLIPFNAVVVALVVVLAYWIDLSFTEWPLRMLAAVAVAAQVLTFGLMAEGKNRARWQSVAAGLFILGVLFFGWAWLVPGASGTWLNRAVITMIVMISMIALFSTVPDKALARESDWPRALRGWTAWMAFVGIVALVFVLCTEVFYQLRFGAVRINWLALVTVAAALCGASVMCIVFAVSPKRDPLRLEERGRMRYVYVAEALLALLFMHIRLTMPWLFSGFFERYWPLVVVGLAYLGVAISEALRRQGLMVLARPVERTGAMLPLLPVLGFWAVASRVDFSLLLFITGALYGGLSILRRSFGFGLLAALCGNGGLWYILHRTDSYGLLQHPQLWLIPAALSVLVAAYLNRDRFNEDQMMSIRYITLMVIYVSSTSDIFINGVAQSPWLPLVLAGLSVAGVLCGIMLRVRAFLFLGATFLLIAVLTMIWYASVNLGWTWLWYVAGIVTGALIIFTFALFEKKRGEVLRVVEDLRGWSR